MTRLINRGSNAVAFMTLLRSYSVFFSLDFSVKCNFLNLKDFQFSPALERHLAVTIPTPTGHIGPPQAATVTLPAPSPCYSSGTTPPGPAAGTCTCVCPTHLLFFCTPPSSFSKAPLFFLYTSFFLSLPPPSFSISPPCFFLHAPSFSLYPSLRS